MVNNFHCEEQSSVLTSKNLWTIANPQACPHQSIGIGRNIQRITSDKLKSIWCVKLLNWVTLVSFIERNAAGETVKQFGKFSRRYHRSRERSLQVLFSQLLKMEHLVSSPLPLVGIHVYNLEPRESAWFMDRFMLHARSFNPASFIKHFLDLLLLILYHEQLSSAFVSCFFVI